MKVAEALDLIRRVGAVEISRGNLKLKFPETERTALQPAIDILRSGKAEALTLLAEPVSERMFTSWAEWKASVLNRLFLEQGTAGQPGRITAATVRHGERQQQITPAVTK